MPQIPHKSEISSYKLCTIITSHQRHWRARAWSMGQFIAEKWLFNGQHTLRLLLLLGYVCWACGVRRYKAAFFQLPGETMRALLAGAQTSVFPASQGWNDCLNPGSKPLASKCFNLALFLLLQPLFFLLKPSKVSLFCRELSSSFL